MVQNSNSPEESSRRAIADFLVQQRIADPEEDDTVLEYVVDAAASDAVDVETLDDLLGGFAPTTWGAINLDSRLAQLSSLLHQVCRIIHTLPLCTNYHDAFNVTCDDGKCRWHAVNRCAPVLRARSAVAAPASTGSTTDRGMTACRQLCHSSRLRSLSVAPADSRALHSATQRRMPSSAGCTPRRSRRRRCQSAAKTQRCSLLKRQALLSCPHSNRSHSSSGMAGQVCRPRCVDNVASQHILHTLDGCRAAWRRRLTHSWSGMAARRCGTRRLWSTCRGCWRTGTQAMRPAPSSNWTM